jgi:hypothetical protein
MIVYLLLLSLTLSSGPVHVYMPVQTESQCRAMLKEIKNAHPSLIYQDDKECLPYDLEKGEEMPEPDPRT